MTQKKITKQGKTSILKVLSRAIKKEVKLNKSGRKKGETDGHDESGRKKKKKHKRFYSFFHNITLGTCISYRQGHTDNNIRIWGCYGNTVWQER